MNDPTSDAAPLPRPPFWVRLPLALLLLAIPALILIYSDKFVIDDAFIGYRHAHNIAVGRGPVFNAGERVEGFTNLLWTLITVIPLKVGWRPEAFSAITGAALAAIAMLRAGRTASLAGATPYPAMLAMLPLALYTGYWRYAVSGLEGALFSLLLVETTAAVLLRRPMWLVGLLGGLLFATRPESAGLLPAFALVAFALHRSQSSSRVAAARSTLPMLVVWIAFIAAITAWRLLYYGHPVPNSVTAKSVSFSDLPALRANIAAGWAYTIDYALSAGALVATAALGVVLRPLAAPVILVAMLLAGAVVVCLVHGGDWMANHRLLSVYAPLLVIPAGLGIRRAVQLALTRRWGPLIPAAALALAAGLLLRAGAHERWLRKPSFALYPDAPIYGEIADLLRPVLEPDDILSSEGLGLFGYRLPDTDIHDFLGLTDEHIAHHGTMRNIYGRRDYAYTINTIRPAAIILHSGPFHIEGFAREHDGPFGDAYEVYRIGAQQPNPAFQMMLVVRADASARFTPAFKRLGLTRVPAPTPPR